MEMTWRGMSGGCVWTCDWMLIWQCVVGGLKSLLKAAHVRHAFCERFVTGGGGWYVCSFSSHSLGTLWSSVIDGGGGCEIIM